MNSLFDLSVEELVNRLLKALQTPNLKYLDFIIPGGYISELKEQPESWPFLIVEGCLGIPVNTIAPITKYAWAEFKGLRNNENHNIEEANYNEANDLTKVLVLFNGSNHTAWNWRKEHGQHLGHEFFKQELEFVRLLLTYKRHSKTDLVWHHSLLTSGIYDGKNRVWLLEKYHPFGNDSSDCYLLKEWWNDEKALIETACTVHPRNYHAWKYRWWCLKQIIFSYITQETQLEVAAVLSSAGGFGDRDNKANPEFPKNGSSLIREEWIFVSTWISKHPSDYTAYHHSHMLVSHIIHQCTSSDNPMATRSLLVGMIRTAIHELNSVYSSYESKWYHLRWCAGQLCGLDDTQSIIDEELVPFIASWKLKAKSLQQQSTDESSDSSITARLALQTIRWLGSNLDIHPF